nr:MAG TPA: hypothetical protein [Caudoviricetes sp.]
MFQDDVLRTSKGFLAFSGAYWHSPTQLVHFAKRHKQVFPLFTPHMPANSAIWR